MGIEWNVVSGGGISEGGKCAYRIWITNERRQVWVGKFADGVKVRSFGGKVVSGKKTREGMNGRVWEDGWQNEGAWEMRSGVGNELEREVLAAK